MISSQNDITGLLRAYKNSFYLKVSGEVLGSRPPSKCMKIFHIYLITPVRNIISKPFLASF